jgi:hypothetical protein
MPVDLFDTLDAFGRSVVEAVPGAVYAGIEVSTDSYRQWRVCFAVDGQRFSLSVDKYEAVLFTPGGSIGRRDGDWRALLAERFGGEA